MFDLPGFLAKLDDLVSTAECVALESRGFVLTWEQRIARIKLN